MKYHPPRDGKIDWVNQVVKDMFKMYVMKQLIQREEYIHLVEFTYNNNHHESLKMSPFEVVYGRRCRTLVN